MDNQNKPGAGMMGLQMPGDEQKPMDLEAKVAELEARIQALEAGQGAVSPPQA